MHNSGSKHSSGLYPKSPPGKQYNDRERRGFEKAKVSLDIRHGKVRAFQI